jgi:hypothetical protein
MFGPVRRPLVPAALMLVVLVVVTTMGGRAVGLACAISLTIANWVVNFEPAFSLKLSGGGEDAAAVLAQGTIAVGLVAIVDVLSRRERDLASRAALFEVAHAEGRETIRRMQEALLPAAVPPSPGLSLRSAWRVGGTAEHPVGGDWYVFAPISDGCYGVAIGDVVGHGIDALSLMARYRFTLLTLASVGGEPRDVMARFERATRPFLPASRFTTCIYGVIDRRSDTLTYTSAGHLPPLLVRNGSTRILEAPHGPPISALGDHPPYRQSVEEIRPGDRLVLYTDGLVELRHRPLDPMIRELATTVADVRLDPGEVLDQFVDDRPSDDAAIVTVDVLPLREGEASAYRSAPGR